MPDGEIGIDLRRRDFSAEQTTVQRSAREEHLFDGRVYGWLLQDIATSEFDLKLRAAAHQFFDKRGADAFGAADDCVHQLLGNLQAASIELRKLGASFFVGQRKLYRLIDATGA